MQSLYIDPLEDDGAQPSPIHPGFRSGIDVLEACLDELNAIGINHVALNLRFNQAEIGRTLDCLAGRLVPRFTA